MAIQASGRKSTAAINSQRVLYYIHKFISDLSPADITIVDDDPAGGDWASETGPGDGAWLVLESAYEVNGKKWQMFIGGRSTAENLSAGLTGSYQGIWVAWAPNGGWDSTSEDFGSELTWGPWKVDATGNANMGPINMEMSVVPRLDASGTTVDVAFIWIGDNRQNGIWDSGIYGGAIRPASSSQTQPTACLIGVPDWHNNIANWGDQTDGSDGACLSSDLSALQAAFIDPSQDPHLTASWMLTDDGGEPYGAEIMLFNLDTKRVKGRLVEVYRTDDSIADGTKNAAGDRIIFNGLIFPSAP